MPPQNLNLKNAETLRAEHNFKVEVVTTPIERPEDLPVELLRFIVKYIIFDVHSKLGDAAKELFEEQFPVIDDSQTKDELLEIIRQIKENFSDVIDIAELFADAYPTLYQVKNENPDDPIVSIVTLSDKFADKHILGAWTAAATSRTTDPYSKMFQDMIDMVAGDENSAALKLEKWGINHGHASILELIPVYIFINQIPITDAYLIHHLIETYASQESSTRYIEFLNLYIKPIEDCIDLSTIPEEFKEDREFIINEWKALQELLMQNFQKWKGLIGDAYQEKFGDFDAKGKKIGDSTKDARMFDIARAWLPMGLPTSLAVLSNLRTLIALLRMLREANSKEHNKLADQIELTLRIMETPEGKGANMRLGPMIKHSEAQNIMQDNIQTLQQHLIQVEGFSEMLANVKRPDNYNRETVLALLDNADNVIITVIQYIKVAYPALNEYDILDWLGTLNADQQAVIGSIIWKGHTKYQPMGNNMGNIKGDKVVIIKAALAQLRDWNRHRASGKADVGFILPIHHSKGPIDFTPIIDQGFVTSVQIMNTNGLKHLEQEWKDDANNYYERLQAYYEFVRARFPEESLAEFAKLIPLGHQTSFHFSTPVSQQVYTDGTRDTTGNDLTNRFITKEMVRLLTQSPFLRDVVLTNEATPLDFEDSIQYAERK